MNHLPSLELCSEMAGYLNALNLTEHSRVTRDERYIANILRSIGDPMIRNSYNILIMCLFNFYCLFSVSSLVTVEIFAAAIAQRNVKNNKMS